MRQKSGLLSQYLTPHPAPGSNRCTQKGVCLKFQGHGVPFHCQFRDLNLSFVFSVSHSDKSIKVQSYQHLGQINPL